MSTYEHDDDAQPCDLTDYSDRHVQHDVLKRIQDILPGLPERYHSTALACQESLEPLFAKIGDDLTNSSEGVRREAFSAYYVADPTLGSQVMDALDERETHRPGYRLDKGTDQRFLNGSIDILTTLFCDFVLQSSFDPKKARDPRPYVHRTIDNWKKNQARRDARLETLNLPDPDYLLGNRVTHPTVEDEALARIAEASALEEFTTNSYLTEREASYYYAQMLGYSPADLAEREGIDPHTVTQAQSQGRIRTLERAEYCLVDQLIRHGSHRDTVFTLTGHADWFIRGMQAVMQPALDASANLPDEGPVIFPLTPAIGRRPPRLYIAIDRTSKTYLKSEIDAWNQSYWQGLQQYFQRLSLTQIADGPVLSSMTLEPGSLIQDYQLEPAGFTPDGLEMVKVYSYGKKASFKEHLQQYLTPHGGIPANYVPCVVSLNYLPHGSRLITWDMPVLTRIMQRFIEHARYVYFEDTSVVLILLVDSRLPIEHEKETLDIGGGRVLRIPKIPNYNETGTSALDQRWVQWSHQGLTFTKQIRP